MDDDFILLINANMLAVSAEDDAYRALNAALLAMPILDLANALADFLEVRAREEGLVLLGPERIYYDPPLVRVYGRRLDTLLDRTRQWLAEGHDFRQVYADAFLDQLRQEQTNA